MKSLIAVLVLPLLMLTSFAYAQDVFQTVDPTEAGFDTEVLAQVNEDIEAKIADGKLVGAIGLIAKGDDVVFAETWGQRDREAELPMTEDTIFRIYSMSKPITSVAAMILAEQVRQDIGSKKVINKKTNQDLGRITVSIGAGQLIKNEPIGELIRRADEALYFAKNAGRDQVASEYDVSQSNLSAAAKTG